MTRFEDLNDCNKREKYGRNMNFTSMQCSRIIRELRKGNTNYIKSSSICEKCNGKGWVIDKTKPNPKSETCSKCKGYGFYLKRL
jgi:DnaJ-class molecular chaperone